MKIQEIIETIDFESENIIIKSNDDKFNHISIIPLNLDLVQTIIDFVKREKINPENYQPYATAFVCLTLDENNNLLAGTLEEVIMANPEILQSDEWYISEEKLN